jgi:hypothetical protein
MSLTAKEQEILNRTAAANSGKGFTPTPKTDRPAAAPVQQQTATAPVSTEDATDQPFDLSPAIAVAIALVGEEAVNTRIAEYREDELTDEEIAGYLPRWAKRKAAQSTALTVATDSNKTIGKTQKTGLESATAFIHKQRQQRDQIIDQVSEAIAYLSDPVLLEADIMSAAAAKVQARSGGWDYAEPVVDFDNLFALPESSQRMLGGA